MWIFTKNGFFSAVQNERDSGLIHVRARFKGDLERLCKAYDIKPKVLHTPKNDYPFRMDFERETWSRIMAEEAKEIDYTNFKDKIHKDCNDGRLDAYNTVWGIMKLHEYL